MNDDKLKDFLKENRQVPPRPHHEWSEILHKMETDQEKSLLPIVSQLKNLGFGLGAVTMMTIFYITFIMESPTNKTNLQQIDNFLVSDSYFYETESQHEWIDDI